MVVGKVVGKAEVGKIADKQLTDTLRVAYIVNYNATLKVSNLLRKYLSNSPLSVASIALLTGCRLRE